MNLGMSASTIRMPFLSKNFDFLEKVLTKREGQQKFYKINFPLPFRIATTNNKDKRISIVQSVLLVIVTDGLGGSVKPAHHKLLLPTPNYKIAKYNVMLILKYQLT